MLAASEQVSIRERAGKRGFRCCRGWEGYVALLGGGGGGEWWELVVAMYSATLLASRLG